MLAIMGITGDSAWLAATRRAVRRLDCETRAVVLAGADLVLPRTCPGCHAPESWCGACAATIEGRPTAVALPEAILDRFGEERIALPSVHALARYSGPIRAAVIAGKERNRRDLPPLIGRSMGLALARLQDVGVLPDEPWLVPAPTRRSAARARGGDPVTAMARAAAALLASRGRPAGVAPCLYTARGARDSVGLSAAGRVRNLAHSVRFDARAAPPSGAAVVLLDDVLTSGATVLQASLTLSTHGLAPIGALVAASVPPLRPALFRAGGMWQSDDARVR